MMKFIITVAGAELATILAALRFYQHVGHGRSGQSIRRDPRHRDRLRADREPGQRCHRLSHREAGPERAVAQPAAAQLRQETSPPCPRTSSASSTQVHHRPRPGRGGAARGTRRQAACRDRYPAARPAGERRAQREVGPESARCNRRAGPDGVSVIVQGSWSATPSPRQGSSRSRRCGPKLQRHE